MTAIMYCTWSTRYTLCLKKRTNFKTVQLEIIRVDFDYIWLKCSKYSRIEFACFTFCASLLFYHLSCFKLDTENNTNFDTVSGNCIKFDKVRFFKVKHTHKRIIFGTHNLQTFKHNIGLLINELLLAQFYLFNIHPKLHHRQWRNHASRCSKLAQLHQQPVDAVFRPTFIRKLCYKLLSIVTFIFMQTFDPNFIFFLNGTMLTGSVTRNFQNLRYFRWLVWKTKSW